MDQNKKSVEKRAVYINIDDIKAQVMEGLSRTFRKDLLRSEFLEIGQIIIKGSGAAEDYGTSRMNRLQFVVNGKATLQQGGVTTDISRGNLIIIPPGIPWGTRLSVDSDQLTLIEIRQKHETGDTSSSSESVNHDAIRIIRPEDVPSYRPAGHLKTTNRCLYLDEHVEIIRGLIEAGGGAERHFHQDHEQFLGVIERENMPLLIYYPRGTPHGTGGGVSTPLDLLVIYSPPLGESQNALE